MAKVFNMVVDASGIGVITFDVVGEAMNTWTEEAFIGFDRVMQELEIAKGIRGIIFISGKPENFLAGANLRLISQIESAEEVRDPRPLPRRRSGILARLYGPDRQGGEEHPHRPAGV
jgi:3-hydroxyacyl-CoA dehydrogenase/enoyl-CoA hydratase/3-hydroxybutyryl-CoA epimerase